MSDLTTSTNSKLEFRLAQSEKDFAKASPLILHLNPTISVDDFWHYTKAIRSHGNYTLYLAVLDQELVGICGCWIATKFYSGKYLEIDNFIIHPDHQRNGYGRDFLVFIDALAEKENCETIMLDAFLENRKAHNFYESGGYEPKGYHFLKKVGHKPS